MGNNSNLRWAIEKLLSLYLKPNKVTLIRIEMWIPHDQTKRTSERSHRQCKCVAGLREHDEEIEGADREMFKSHIVVVYLYVAYRACMWHLNASGHQSFGRGTTHSLTHISYGSNAWQELSSISNVLLLLLFVRSFVRSLAIQHE